jgi:hypothetical protein
MQPAGNRGFAARSDNPMRVASARARRLPLGLSVRYRRVGARRWHEGRVENISRSGVLFRAAALLDVGTPLEMTLALPAPPSAAAIVFRGRVVRTVPPRGVEHRPGLAATISRYRFRSSRDRA